MKTPRVSLMDCHNSWWWKFRVCHGDKNLQAYMFDSSISVATTISFDLVHCGGFGSFPSTSFLRQLPKNYRFQGLDMFDSSKHVATTSALTWCIVVKLVFHTTSRLPQLPKNDSVFQHISGRLFLKIYEDGFAVPLQFVFLPFLTKFLMKSLVWWVIPFFLYGVFSFGCMLVHRLLQHYYCTLRICDMHLESWWVAAGNNVCVAPAIASRLMISGIFRVCSCTALTDTSYHSPVRHNLPLLHPPWA